MNKSDLIDAVAKSTGQAKTVVEGVLDATAAIAQEQLSSGNEVVLHGLGKLKVAHRKARTGRNPATGEPLAIAAKTIPHFVAAKSLKDAVNK